MKFDYRSLYSKIKPNIITFKLLNAILLRCTFVGDNTVREWCPFNGHRCTHSIVVEVRETSSYKLVPNILHFVRDTAKSYLIAIGGFVKIGLTLEHQRPRLNADQIVHFATVMIGITIEPLRSACVRLHVPLIRDGERLMYAFPKSVDSEYFTRNHMRAVDTSDVLPDKITIPVLCTSLVVVGRYIRTPRELTTWSLCDA